ncbi:MAG: glycosyltransferase family 4 protein [Acidobacteriota bacterium]|nr:glycosyltransferase family 4 protein [Acidobacteriota bacterium]
MKLIILSQYYPPEVGAPQARLSELAAAFVRRGHQVTVLTAMPSYPVGKIHDGYGGLYSKESREGVNVIRTFIYPTQSAKLFFRLMNYFSFVISSSVLGAVLLERPDYLLVESPPLFLGIAGLGLSWLKRTRLIFNVSDLWPESAVELGLIHKDTFVYRISAKLEALCYRQALLVTGQSKSSLANIKERFPDCPTFHLSNGVDTTRFKPEHRTDTARSILSSNGSCVALYAGLHGLAQGLDQVLAAARIMAEESEVKFVLIGDGPEKKRLVKEAREKSITNVAFLEVSAAKDIPSLLASADVALVTLKTYISGAVPSKLYEAMASGLPVVLVAEGEAAEIVRQHDAGITVTPGDVHGLIKAMKALINDPPLRRRLGENGRRVAEKYFDRTMISNRFIDHLETKLSSILPDLSI